MTLHEAKLLLAFNSWATQKIFDAVASLPVEQVRQDMKASHRSIHGTLAHLVASEELWCSRLRGIPGSSGTNPTEAPDIADLKKRWETAGFATARWLGTLSDRKLQEPFSFTTMQGATLTHTFAQAIQHLVDHGTYHRGQVVVLLRQLGVKPPSTGMMGFFRETAKLG
jgi:uncharacterized damage-inducible protein DinB